MTVAASVWSSVVGQHDAVERLVHAAADPVHAYLFVGPAGSTKKEAARAFAALLIGGVDDATQRLSLIHISPERAYELLAIRRETIAAKGGPTKKKATKKKAAAKKKPAKKTAAKKTAAKKTAAKKTVAEKAAADNTAAPSDD